MSHTDHGPLSSYNSLVDAHLAGFFANTRLRRQLQKAGLVTRHGEIVSENMYRLNMSRKEHKKHVKDMLAQAIVHKTLDLERARQAEIRKTLEQISKIQLVRRVRESRGRKRDEDVLPYLSSGSRIQSSLSPHASVGRQRGRNRPVSAPARKGKRPLSELSSNYEDDEVAIYLDDEGRPISPAHREANSSRYSSRDSTDTRHLTSRGPIDTKHLATLDSVAVRKYAMLMAKMEQGRGGLTSPYLIPQVPLPPTTPKGGHNPRSINRYRQSMRATKSGSPKRPSTSLHPSGPAKLFPVQQEILCEVSMYYHGSGLSLAREQFDRRQDILVEQQHCGGNTLSVFKDKLEPNSNFSFVSHRHRGYPFSLTIYVDGNMDCRVSTCCEYRHMQGGRIGGKTGHFSIKKITAAIPCYRCQVERGYKVGCQAPKPKLKRPTQHLEEVAVPHVDKSKTPSKEMKRTHEEVPEEETQVLVPVDKIDDQNGNEKYEDDFETSNKSRSSSSSSDSHEEECTDDRREESDDRLRKMKAVRQYGRNKKQVEFTGNMCEPKKTRPVDNDRGHSSSSIAEEIDSCCGDSYFYSSGSYCSDSFYDSDTYYSNNNSYGTDSSETEYCYDQKKMILLKIIEEEARRKKKFKIVNEIANEVGIEEDCLDTPKSESKMHTKNYKNRKKFTRKNSVNRATRICSRSNSNVSSDSNRSMATPRSGTHDTCTMGVSESLGTEDEVSDIESEIASSKKYASICNISVANDECQSLDSDSRHSDYMVNKIRSRLGYAESRTSSRYSSYNCNSDSRMEKQSCNNAEESYDHISRCDMKLGDINMEECIGPRMVSDRIPKTFWSSLQNKRQGCHEAPVNKKLMFVFDNRQTKELQLTHHAVSSVDSGDTESFQERCVDKGGNLDMKQGNIRENCKMDYNGRAKKKCCHEERNENVGLHHEKFRQMKASERCDNYSNDEHEDDIMKKSKYKLARLREDQKVSEKQKIVMSIMDKYGGHIHNKECSSKKSQEMLTFREEVTTYPMVRTGENVHLIKQTQESSKRRRRTAKAKKLAPVGSDNRQEIGFKDLSPPEKVIRGFAGDSTSESNNADIYCDLQIHGKQSGVSDQESKHRRSKCCKGEKGIGANHSTVELDNTSTASKESSQCGVIIDTIAKTKRLEDVDRSNTKETNTIIENVEIEHKLNETFKHSVSVQCHRLANRLNAASPYWSLILNAAVLKNESNNEYMKQYNKNITTGKLELNPDLESSYPNFNPFIRQTLTNVATTKPGMDAQSLIHTNSQVLGSILQDSRKQQGGQFSENDKEDPSVQIVSGQKALPNTKDTYNEGIILKQNEDHCLAVTGGVKCGLKQSAKNFFFIHDDNNTEKFDSRAEIVGTRIVVSEADRYVKHYRAVREAPILTDKHFYSLGMAVSILRPQNQWEGNQGREQGVDVVSVKWPNGSGESKNSHSEEGNPGLELERVVNQTNESCESKDPHPEEGSPGIELEIAVNQTIENFESKDPHSEEGNSGIEPEIVVNQRKESCTSNDPHPEEDNPGLKPELAVNETNKKCESKVPHPEDGNPDMEPEKAVNQANKFCESKVHNPDGNPDIESVMVVSHSTGCFERKGHNSESNPDTEQRIIVNLTKESYESNNLNREKRNSAIKAEIYVTESKESFESKDHTPGEGNPSAQPEIIISSLSPPNENYENISQIPHAFQRHRGRGSIQNILENDDQSRSWSKNTTIGTNDYQYIGIYNDQMPQLNKSSRSNLQAVEEFVQNKVKEYCCQDANKVLLNKGHEHIGRVSSSTNSYLGTQKAGLNWMIGSNAEKTEQSENHCAIDSNSEKIKKFENHIETDSISENYCGSDSNSEKAKEDESHSVTSNKSEKTEHHVNDCGTDSNSETYTGTNSQGFDEPSKGRKKNYKRGKSRIVRMKHLGVSTLRTSCATEVYDDNLEMLYVLNVRRGSVPEVIITNPDEDQVCRDLCIESTNV